MSISLIILSSLIIALAAVPLIKPRTVYEYPFVVGMFLAVWLLPQAFAVERSGLAGGFDPTSAWNYMTLCIVLLVGGYLMGRTTTKKRGTSKGDEIATMYSEKRMTLASAALLIVGVVSYILVVRAAAKTTETSWTGIITFYAMLSQCLPFAATLTFIIYLRTKDKFALSQFFIAFLTLSPVFFIAIKREIIFDFAMIVFCSLFLVRNVVPSRALLITGCVIGAFIVNNAGNIRGYIKNNDSSLIGALTSSEVLDGATDATAASRAPEISGAVTDISIALESGNYRPFRSIYNGMIWRYFPAFIFGREAKDRLMMSLDDNLLSNKFFSAGATRTGFSDTFVDFWYFGIFCFGMLGYLYGRIFNLALAGSLRGQYLYVAMLGTGLHAITHAFSEFVSLLPFLLLVIWLPFRYARITPNERKRILHAMQLQRST